jgi:hypothetical protein
MAAQISKTGVNPTAGPVVTPSPTQPDKDTTFGRRNYGANAFGGASSVSPGKTVTSPLADNLKASGDDGLLDTIAQRGVRDNVANTQTRDISGTAPHGQKPSGNVPPAFGHRSRTLGQEGGKVPNNAAPRPVAPIRKP